MIVVKSKGIRKNKNVRELLGNLIVSDYNPSAQYYAVWGVGKETNKEAEEEAKFFHKHLLRLEDGLIRSYSIEEDTFSLYKSDWGIYYDATNSSSLERMLNSEWRPTQEELFDFDVCLELIRKYKISKYNDSPDIPVGLFRNGKRKILLIDQTFGDKSIEYGLANEKTFEEMLNDALKMSSQYEIYVKVHPEVALGKKRGYLVDLINQLAADDRDKIKLIEENYNAPSVFDCFDKVFVVTSQVGFDALLRNKEVHCYGVPFYSNWGITVDKQKLERRAKSRTIEDIFIAMMFYFTDYINPFTGKKGKLENVLEYISLQKRHANNSNIVFYKTKFWKRINLERFLKASKTSFSFKKSKIDRVKNSLIATWGIESFKELASIKEKCCIEDGFIRSVGLGSNIEDPLSLVVDKQGIYFNPNWESDLEKILNTESFGYYERNRARNVISLLLNKKITKYNVGVSGHHLKKIRELNEDKKIILVPGQVESDASIKYGAVKIKTNFDLLVAVSKNNSNSVIIYKPHPDVLTGNRVGEEPEKEIEKLKKMFPSITYFIEKQANILDCFDISDEVHVNTSTSGLEAILRDKKVITYGLPFYGGYGLTQDMEIFPRERRRLSKEELILGCYLLYPRYMLPGKSVFTNAESAINFVDSQIRQESVLEKSVVNQIRRRIRLCIKTVQALTS